MSVQSEPFHPELTERRPGHTLEPVADDIRLRARDRLRTGALPRDAAELSMAGIPDGTCWCNVHFHGRCHDAWLMERQVLGTP
jgi:hypothetical protein